MSLLFKPVQLLISTLLIIMAGTAQATSLAPRDSQADPQAGKVLAIILGCVVGGLSLTFLLFGLWVWHRIKKNRILEAEEAARAAEEGRTSADTAVEGRDNELRDMAHQEDNKTHTNTTQTAV
ncbi:hypothetical protein GE09DRAFT_1124762 [Coniochaeta sp. 2T2.1]|nr:hypothetical protein GE09DRAFT_1124762 [Coniochaeta sp. 2T2.1]